MYLVFLSPFLTVCFDPNSDYHEAYWVTASNANTTERPLLCGIVVYKLSFVLIFLSARWRKRGSRSVINEFSKFLILLGILESNCAFLSLNFKYMYLGLQSFLLIKVTTICFKLVYPSNVEFRISEFSVKLWKSVVSLVYPSRNCPNVWKGKICWRNIWWVWCGTQSRTRGCTNSGYSIIRVIITALWAYLIQSKVKIIYFI